jgi:cobalt-zinc-cadmium efflux system outer membrane protein
MAALRGSSLLLVLGICGCGPMATPLGFRQSETAPGLPREPQPATIVRAKPNASSLPARPSADGIIQASATEFVPAANAAVTPPANTGVTAPADVDDYVRLALQRNPRLARATFAIDAAKGRYIQAGLYPNIELSENWEDIGDRTGPGGIWTNRLTQTFVTGRKLSLSQRVVAAEVDQSSLTLMAERYAVIGGVRTQFYEVLALQRRLEILHRLLGLAEESVKYGQSLLENKQIARLDLVQLEVERERYRAEAEAVERELPSVQRRLAAAVGDPRLAIGKISGPYETLPSYDQERTIELVLAAHPEVRHAQVGVERAQAALRRARVEPIPNLTAFAGYEKQNENRSNDFQMGLSAPIPVWNRNQGNIRAAQADLGVAVHEVGRVENVLLDRVAVAFRAYAAARQRAERYRADIIPRAEETYDLSLKAFKGGQFEYLRVIQSQRAVAEARLEYNKSLGDAWKAAAEISGLLLEESWPGPVVLPAPRPAPQQ